MQNVTMMISHPFVILSDPFCRGRRASHTIFTVLDPDAPLYWVHAGLLRVVHAHETRVGETNDVLVIPLMHIHVRTTEPQTEIFEFNVFHFLGGEGTDFAISVFGPLSYRRTVIDTIGPPI